MGTIFFELTLIICLAALLAIICRLIKQPLILAYIVTGMIIGPLGAVRLGNADMLRTLGELGITLLLFVLGLELKITDLRSIGKTALFAGVIQICLTFSLGFLFATLLNFSVIASTYIAIALTFSSTIIVVKLLSDQKELNSLSSKITIAILLVQDLFAIFALIILSGFSAQQTHTLTIYPFISVILKGIVLFALVLYLSIKVLPRLVDMIAKSSEALFLVSLAFAFGMAAFVSSPLIGFSIEVGGLLAGLALANSNENLQIVARVRALRDFFIIIFFVFLGTQLTFSAGKMYFPLVLVFLIFVLAYKPILSMLILAFLGYRKRTSFLAATNLAQISEFSLIVIFLGNKLGHVSGEVVSIITLVGVISFVVSNYLILDNKVYFKLFDKAFFLYEKKVTHQELSEAFPLKDHIILIGVHRMGGSILDALEDIGAKVVVVDFDPEVVKKLKKRNVNCIFGDIADIYIQEKAQLNNAKLIISTVPDLKDNLYLIKELNHENRKARIIVMASEMQDAKVLYKAGADYVILPHLAGGRYIAKILKENHLEDIGKFKAKDLISD